MPHRDRDGGFTLIELLVVMALIGLMAGLAVGGYARWAKASAHVGSARELQTTMRQAQQQAVTEGRAICVWVDAAAETWTVYRGACEVTTKVLLTGPHRTGSGSVRLDAPAFTAGSTTSAGVTFYARGTATPGEVTVTRDGSTKEYLVKVEGLTGRVSLG